MTSKTAAWLGVAALLLAWLASAGGLITQEPDAGTSPVAVPTSGAETLAQEVQAQTERLRERLAAAPAPQPAQRDPFAFASPAPAPRRQRAARAIEAPLAPPVPAEPALELIGVAEKQTPSGVVRTAIVTAGGDEIFMVTAGERLGGRYTVASVGVDLVELSDLQTGASRRLVLR